MRIITWFTRVLTGALTVSLLSLLVGCGGSSEDKLVIGMELNYPPFEMKDERGNPSGVSVDMANALGESLGKKIEIRDISFEGLIPALQSDRLDCVISSMTITPERSEVVTFSDPYVRTGICMLVQKGSEVKVAEDLNQEGRRIAVKIGTTGDLYAREHLSKAEIVVLRDASNCALEVAQGKADAFIYDQISIYQFWQKHIDTTEALLKPIRQEDWGIAMQPDDAELQGQINAFLKDYREAGGFEELGDKWFEQWKDNFEQLGVSFVF